MGKIISILFLFANSLYASDAFPRLEGETLAGNAVTLPDVAKGKPTLLIISFSRAAQAQTQEWGTRAGTRKIPSLSIYQVLELEDVPRMFRGFVKGGIRKGIPKDQQARFILLFQGEDQLKRLTNFQNDREAYLLLLDASGAIQYREHGPVTDQKLDALAKGASGRK